MFGSNSSLPLSTEQRTSPTLRIPCGTTCLGICSVRPVHVRPGLASHVTWIALIRRKPPQIGLVDECPHANVAQIGHFGEHVANFHVIPGAHGQRIERPVHRSDHVCRA